MDQSYRVVKTVESSGAGASSDMHEFRMTPFSNGTTALMTVYQPRQYDLTTNARFNLEGGLGWIVEGVFQEVDIETGRVVFEWRSLDHVDPSQAWTLPGTTDTSGDGLHEQSPWDYFHLNSIDKNAEGDYLLSARHVSAIYKVSGQDGHIIWQLGGNSPTFEQTNFQFSYQHHARWISENSTHTVFSFYDNASNNYNSTGEFSHGWIIVIDHVAETATMVKEWGAPEPEGGMLSTSQGNMQLLPNGGCHIGWGEHAYFSEHTADGVVVQYGKLAERTSNVMIYRSNKYNWTAQPVTKPAMWSYSRTGEKKTSFWVSWNGATEVKKWSLYVGGSATGPFELAGFADKMGFETEFHIQKFVPWAYAEAVDGEGRVLERSVKAKTFVPSESLRPHCDDRGCEYASRVPQEMEVPYDVENHVEQKFLSTSREFDTSDYYADSPEPPTPTPEPAATNDPSIIDDETDDDTEEDWADSTNDGETGTVALGVGLMLGFTVAVLGFFLWRSGGIKRLQGKTVDFADGMANTQFGSKLLGRYTRVRDKEMDGLGFDKSSGSSSTRTSGLA